MAKNFLRLFVLPLLLSVVALLARAGIVFADCGQPVVHNDGKECPLYFVQALVQDEKAQPVYNALVELHLSNGDIQYGVTDRGGIFVFGIPEVWGVDSIALADGQSYEGWSQFKVWGSDCDWFNITLVVRQIEVPQEIESPTNPESTTLQGGDTQDVMNNSGQTATAMNTYGDVNIYQTIVSTTVNNLQQDEAVNESVARHGKISHPTKDSKSGPIMPALPNPYEPMYPDGWSLDDVHSRHHPTLDTHPGYSYYISPQPAPADTSNLFSTAFAWIKANPIWVIVILLILVLMAVWGISWTLRAMLLSMCFYSANSFGYHPAYLNFFSASSAIQGVLRSKISK